MTPNELFTSAINNGLNAAKLIADQAPKAMAYAAIAQAIALSGMINKADQGSIGPEPEKVATNQKGKDSLKAGAAKKVVETPAPTPDPVPEAAVEEPVAEPELSEEWTDEMMELKSDQLDRYSAIKAEYDITDDLVIEYIKKFSENTLTSTADITPLNIDAFVGFLDMLIQQANTEAK